MAVKSNVKSPVAVVPSRNCSERTCLIFERGAGAGWHTNGKQVQSMSDTRATSLNLPGEGYDVGVGSFRFHGELGRWGKKKTAISRERVM